MALPLNPMKVAGVPVEDFIWWRWGKDTRIACVALEHDVSETMWQEYARVSPDEIALATLKVESYDHLFGPPAYAGAIPPYVGPQPPGAPDADTVLHPRYVFPWMVEGMTQGQVVTPPDVVAPPPPLAVAGPAFCPNCGIKLR